MAWVMREYACPTCEARFDYLASTDENAEKKPCVCGGEGEMVISAPGLHVVNRKNSDYQERQKPRVEARNREHWNRIGRHEAVDRQRIMEKKHGG